MSATDAFSKVMNTLKGKKNYESLPSSDFSEYEGLLPPMNESRIALVEDRISIPSEEERFLSNGLMSPDGANGIKLPDSPILAPREVNGVNAESHMASQLDAEQQDHPKHRRCCRLFKRWRRRHCPKPSPDPEDISPRRRYLRIILVVFLVLALIAGIVVSIWAICKAARRRHMYPAPVPYFPELHLNTPFNISLGCLGIGSVFNHSRMSLHFPMGTDDKDHTFDIRGGTVGAIVITSAPDPEQDFISYDLLIRGDPSKFNAISFIYPEVDDNGRVTKSVFNITTPPVSPSPVYQGPNNTCLRTDVTIYVPRSLKRLYIAGHSRTHVQFAPDAHIELDDLSVVLSDTSYSNMIQPHESVHAKNLSLFLVRGWISGGVSIVDQTKVKNSNGLTKLNVTPTAPVNFDNPEPAVLKTITGSDSMEIIYTPNDGYRRRPIHSSHISQGWAGIALRYGKADFKGLLELYLPVYYAPGVTPLGYRGGVEEDDDDETHWTHYFWDRNGPDRMYVRSPSRVGIFLLRDRWPPYHPPYHAPTAFPSSIPREDCRFGSCPSW